MHDFYIGSFYVSKQVSKFESQRPLSVQNLHIIYKNTHQNYTHMFTKIHCTEHIMHRHNVYIGSF